MDVAFYSEKQLDKITSLSRMTRWRMRRLGTFPNPVHISAGRVGYRPVRGNSIRQHTLLSWRFKALVSLPSMQ